jgi:type IV secretion system protein TrbL
MNKPVIAMKPFTWLLFLLLAFFSAQAFAAVDSVGVLNNVLSKFEAASSNWQAIMTTRATWLFWLLVVISMVWTFGFMALRKADIGEFFAEYIRFTIFTGFFWWLLLNGPQFANDIIRSLRTIGAQASGMPNDLTPSGIVDIGFDIFFKVLDQATLWKPMDSLFGMLLGAAILLMFALIGVNMLLLLVSGYFFAYAGVFILGFGGSKWTSEMAIGYYKSILNIALQLMAMVLIIGIGRSFIDDYYTAMSAGVSLKEMGVMVVVGASMLFLVAKVPPQVGALAGGTTGNLGSNFGVGAAVGAAAVAAAAVATAGAAIAAGAAGAAGGAQALMAAYSKASAAQSAGGGAGSLLTAAGGGTGGDAGGGNAGSGGSSLAAAMGDSGASSSSSGSAGPDSGGESNRSAGTGAESGGSAGSSASSDPLGAGATGSGAGDGSPGELKRGGKLTAVGAMAARAGKVTAGTAANLAVGSWDVAKGKAADMKAATIERIGQTTGGKIAAAIEARGAIDKAAKFDENSLSAGADDKTVDAAAEIAQFRDRGSKLS